MAVQNQTPYNEYTANGSTTSFALGFDCESQNHLIVLVDNNPPEYGSWYLNNNTVVFYVAPKNNQKISFKRETPLKRETDFQSYDNSFRPTPVNKDFDRIWWKLQELGVADWLLGLKIDKEIKDRIAADIYYYQLTTKETDEKLDELKDYIEALVNNITGKDFLPILDKYIKTWSGRTQEEKNRDFISVNDYGYIGDGSYHSLAELYNSLALAQFAYANIATEINSLDQSIDFCAIQSALRANVGSQVYMTTSHGFIDRTIMIPKGTRLIGSGDVDYWSEVKTGTIIETYGSGNGSQWTDIGLGFDNLDFTPAIVFEGGASACEKITMQTSNTETGWDAGFFVPATKRNQLIDCYALGRWRSAGLYLDATWGDRNEFLKELHPNVDITNQSMNELYVQGGIYQGHNALWLQGTKRNPDDYLIADWKWSWGGTSDLVFNNVAWRPRRNLINDDSTVLKLDARIKNAAKAGQGIKFNDCWYRAASADVMFDFNSINRVYVSGYAESSSVIPSKFTSNTQAVKFAGRFVNTYIVFDEVTQKTTNSAGEEINVLLDSSNAGLSAISVWSDDGSFYTSTFEVGSNYIRPHKHNTSRLGRGGGETLESNNNRSFERAYIKTIIAGFDNNLELRGNTGITFHPTSSLQTGYWNSSRISFGLSETELLGITTGSASFNGNVLPAVNNSYNLGSSNYRWSQVYAINGTINTSDARLKTDLRTLTKDEILAAKEIKSSIGFFKWLKSIEEKGDDAREHCGVLAQNVIAILEKYNLNPFNYSFICYDSWESSPAVTRTIPRKDPVIDYDDNNNIILLDEAQPERVIVESEAIEAGDMYSIRMSELFMFILAAI